MGKGNIFTSVCLFTGGYLSWLGGAYLGQGGTFLNWGYLPLLGEVLTFFAGVSTLAMGVPSLMGAVLTLTGGTYISWGYLPLLGGGYLP